MLFALSAAGCSADRDISTQLVGSWALHDTTEKAYWVMQFNPDFTGGDMAIGRGTLLGSRFTYTVRDRLIVITPEPPMPSWVATFNDDGTLLVELDKPIVLHRTDDPRFGAPDLLRSPDADSVREWAAYLERELASK